MHRRHQQMVKPMLQGTRVAAANGMAKRQTMGNNPAVGFDPMEESG